jgi:hypothetical protein
VPATALETALVLGPALRVMDAVGDAAAAVELLIARLAMVRGAVVEV